MQPAEKRHQARRCIVRYFLNENRFLRCHKPKK
jgi:hypothetical protein